MNTTNIQTLNDLVTNGSIAYEFSTKIAPKKINNAIGTVIVGNTARRVSQWCNPSKAPPQLLIIH
jgi:hypothetical protein